MRAIKLILMPFALALLAGAALIVPAAAQANPSTATLKLGSEVFPSGKVLTGGMSGTIPVVGGSTVTVTAPGFVYVPPPATAPAGTPGMTYEFLFWNADGTPKSTATATFAAPGSGSFDATAWYIPYGGGCSSMCPPPQVSTWAFSLTKNAVLPGTPIMAATSGWTSPSTSVLTAENVKITAFSFLGPHTKFSWTSFHSWLALPSAGTKASGVNLTVEAGKSPYAIAFYRQYTTTPPPPPPHV